MSQQLTQFLDKLMKTLKVVVISILLIGSSIAFAQPVAQGTFNNATYIAVLAPDGITWAAAEASAVAMGGHLASITSTAENQFVYSLACTDTSLWMPLNGGGFGPWLGGYRLPSDPRTSFHWIDGTAFSYSNWANYQPDNYGGNEYYIQFYCDGGALTRNTWNDAPNTTIGDPNHVGIPNPHGYIVEIVPEAGTTCLFLLGAAVFGISRFRRGATGAATR
jgi:hypothetical protein